MKKILNTILMGLLICGLIIGGIIIGVIGTEKGLAPKVVHSFLKEEEKEELYHIELEPFLVNLLPSENEITYLHIELTIVVKGEEVFNALTEQTSKVRDQIIRVITKETKNDILKYEGNELYIKEELIKELNSLTDNEGVEEVLVTNLLVQ